MENNNLFENGTQYKKIEADDLNNLSKNNSENSLSFNDVLHSNTSLESGINSSVSNDVSVNQVDNNIFLGNSNEGKDNVFSNVVENVGHSDVSIEKKNSRIPIIIFVLVFFSGMVLMFYPTVNNIINNSRHKFVINHYQEEVDSASVNLKKEMLDGAHEYNKKLNMHSIQDVFSIDKVSHDVTYDNLLKLTDDGLMGYIEIPKINIKLPIYHTTSEEVLEKGVGHLKGSSLPVGGVGTHSILAAHRGLPTSKLFSDLDKVVVGDKFYISILDEKFIYQVDNVAVVSPHDLDLMQIDEDKDYVTLVTCTPYGVNTHRLLVRGSRIDELESSESLELDNKELIYLSNDDKVLIGIVAVIFIIIIVFVIRMLVKKK